jgi:hypothetical protein
LSSVSVPISSWPIWGQFQILILQTSGEFGSRNRFFDGQQFKNIQIKKNYDKKMQYSSSQGPPWRTPKLQENP